MEEQVTRLVDKAWGKTTLASIITSRLNERHQRHFASDIAAFVPMDGYHLSRAQLAALPDPARAFARRGAPFTFDGAGFVSLVQQLHTPLFHRSPTIYAPAFDHALQDPTPHAIALTPQTRIVVFEGNYLALRDPPWPEAARLLDELCGHGGGGAEAGGSE
ncbi:MAG: hypothetical protein M1826_004793 [Phylliscum demangeonii]|nr:MAG: hypothetical protein M1826_004793 [Phylliscum demangeonii]